MFIVLVSMPYVYIHIYTFNIDSLTDYKYKHLNYAVIARLAQNNIGGGPIAKLCWCRSYGTHYYFMCFGTICHGVVIGHALHPVSVMSLLHSTYKLMIMA
jgi:hypothetical protein